MKTSKVIFSLFMGIAMLTVQVGSVLAAPALQDGGLTGEVTALTCGTDGTTIIVTYNDDNPEPQEAEISLGIAVTLGFLPEGTEICDEALLVGIGNSIDPADLISADEQPKHPIGKALAAFFDFAEYDVIMDAHENGSGFGVIAQALWMTKNLENGTQDDFLAILEAKETGDYSYFASLFDEGETPENWGQFKKAMLNGDKKNNLGAVMSDKDNKEDKTNNGKGHDNGNKDKDKDKDKNKDS